MSENHQNPETSNDMHNSPHKNPDQDITKDAGAVSPIPEEAPSSIQETGDLPPREIFVVLSERDEFNAECLHALKNYGIKSIVLNLPNETRSISEILSTSVKVKFALVLLSGDDFIYDRLNGKPGEACLGAKPDVVFQLGYVLAKFGHLGTLALYREQKSFRLPTGFQHATFVPFQKNGNWKEILENKLKALKIL